MYIMATAVSIYSPQIRPDDGESCRAIFAELSSVGTPKPPSTASMLNLLLVTPMERWFTPHQTCPLFPSPTMMMKNCMLDRMGGLESWISSSGPNCTARSTSLWSAYAGVTDTLPLTPSHGHGIVQPSRILSPSPMQPSSLEN